MFPCKCKAIGGLAPAFRQVFWPVFARIHGQIKQRRITVFAANRRARLLQLGDEYRVGREVGISEHSEIGRANGLIKKVKGEHNGLALAIEMAAGQRQGDGWLGRVRFFRMQAETDGVAIAAIAGW